VWEIKQKTLVNMAVDRGCYIDQSQSLNIYMDQPDTGKLTSLHFYAWSKVSTLMQCLIVKFHTSLMVLQIGPNLAILVSPHVHP
jgi:hypothetical protein